MKYDFAVVGASYIGNPKPNTVMYVTNKVGYLLENLRNIEHCLIYAQKGLDIDKQLERKHCFIVTDNPQMEYARFADGLFQERERQESELGYVLTEKGFYRSSTAIVGENAVIEPGVLIGHNVVIGRNARIMAGASIKNVVIGDDFICGQNAVVGSYGFTMTKDENGDTYRIPPLGKVRIGNRVEIGVSSNVCCGSAGDTMLEDCVKLDAFVNIGHDVLLHRNVEITSGVTVGGFAVLEEGVYAGMGSCIRNRITIGSHAVIGMGAVVTKSTERNTTMAGNPARPLSGR